MVLDVEEGAANGKDKLFVLLKKPFGSTPFSTDGKPYCPNCGAKMDGGAE